MKLKDKFFDVKTFLDEAEKAKELQLLDELKRAQEAQGDMKELKPIKVHIKKATILLKNQGKI